MSMSAYRQDKSTVPLPVELAKGGNTKDFDVAISAIEMANGEKIIPPRAGVTVVVGGNNAGKSTFLRDLWTKLSRPAHSVYKSRLIESVSLVREGDEADVFSWFNENVPWSGTNTRPGFVNEKGSVTRIIEIRRFCEQGSSPKSLSDIADHIVQRGDLHNRIQVVSPVDQRDDLGDPPKHPIHRIQDNPAFLELIQRLGVRIFRQDLTLDRLGGKTQLRVGIPDGEPPQADRISPEYTQSVAQLETLEQQGDGMKSLMGLLMPLVTGQYRIMLIDEPEAFLHPPQAKIVGKVLGELAVEQQTQIFLATHDRNLLVGLLEAEASVTVVRLDRNAKRTVAHQLNHQAVQELWNEPVLRYSNVLDGLFHRAVVLAESDRDCRFYAASLDSAGELPFMAGDVQFIPAGGKDGFARIVKALRSVSVPSWSLPI